MWRTEIWEVLHFLEHSFDPKFNLDVMIRLRQQYCSFRCTREEGYCGFDGQSPNLRSLDRFGPHVDKSRPLSNHFGACKAAAMKEWTTFFWYLCSPSCNGEVLCENKAAVMYMRHCLCPSGSKLFCALHQFGTGAFISRIDSMRSNKHVENDMHRESCSGDTKKYNMRGVFPPVPRLD